MPRRHCRGDLREKVPSNPKIEKAVRAVRANLPYQPRNCLNEAHMLSMYLTDRGIDNIIEIGEAVDEEEIGRRWPRIWSAVLKRFSRKTTMKRIQK